MFQLHRELDEMLGRAFGQEWAPASSGSEPGPVAWAPAIESYAKDGELHVRVALPGVDPKDVEVTVADDRLTIRGERRTAAEDKAGGRFVREFAYGSFERVLAIPAGVDPGQVRAKFVNGMLDLTMPAPLTVAPKKVEIEVEGAAGQAKAIKAG